MLRRLSWSGTPFQIFSDVPGASGAGGGSAAATGETSDAGDAGGADEGSEAGGDEGTSDVDEAEPSDDELLYGDGQEADYRTLPAEEQLKRVLRQNAKLRTRYGKLHGIRQQLGDRDVADLITRDRDFRQLEQQLRANPRLRALLTDGDTGRADRSESRRSPLPQLPEQFDVDSLGFDPKESRANQVLAAAIQHVAELRKEVSRLSNLPGTVEQLNRSFQSREQRDSAKAWESTQRELEGRIKAVVADPKMAKVVTLFMGDALAGARSGNYDATRILNHYLGQLQAAGVISAKGKTALTAGVQSAIARRNTQLPKHQAGGGTPAPASSGQPRQTLKDVHRRLRTGAIGPRAANG